jgi:hypothetical protein
VPTSNNVCNTAIGRDSKLSLLVVTFDDDYGKLFHGNVVRQLPNIQVVVVGGASWREWASVWGFSLLSFSLFSSLLFFSSILLAGEGPLRAQIFSLPHFRPPAPSKASLTMFDDSVW